MKELLVCYTAVFSVVTQRSLVGRSVQNDFQIETNERWIITIRALQSFHSFSPFLAQHPARRNSQGR